MQRFLAELQLQFPQNFRDLYPKIIRSCLAILRHLFSPTLHQVSVSGGAAARTSKKRVEGGRTEMNPVWHDQLWVPTTVPSMSGSIRTTIMDGDMVGGEQVRDVFPALLTLSRVRYYDSTLEHEVSSLRTESIDTLHISNRSPGPALLVRP